MKYRLLTDQSLSDLKQQGYKEFISLFPNVLLREEILRVLEFYLYRQVSPTLLEEITTKINNVLYQCRDRGEKENIIDIAILHDRTGTLYLFGKPIKDDYHC